MFMLYLFWKNILLKKSPNINVIINAKFRVKNQDLYQNLTTMFVIMAPGSPTK